MAEPIEYVNKDEVIATFKRLKTTPENKVGCLHNNHSFFYINILHITAPMCIFFYHLHKQQTLDTSTHPLMN